MKVCVAGVPQPAQVLAETLRREGIEVYFLRDEDEILTELLRKRLLLLRVVSKIDLIHIVGGFSGLKSLLLAHIMRKKVICHWIGTDFLLAASRTKYQILTRLISKIVDLHLACSETLVRELKIIDITNAIYMPIVPPDLIVELPPLPKKFRVLTYIPRSRPKFYGADIVFHLSNIFPNIEFWIVGNTGDGFPQAPNIRYLGWQKDMNQIYSQISVLLRRMYLALR